MNVLDEALVFECGDVRLVGVISMPAEPGSAGLVIIVGGPQYRAGSHRQFVALARRAATAGVPALRFDYRGMGDSEGTPVGFENADDDVRAAIDALATRCPGVRKVYLWGLCDGASAALMYLQRTGDSRVAGVCILNPWVRTAVTLARAQVKHYYGRRLLQREFWAKLLGGGVDLAGSLREFAGKLRASAAASGGKESIDMTFQGRMAAGLQAFAGDVLLVLSGRDLTAREFLEHANGDPALSSALAGASVARVDLAQADHTFSTAQWRTEVEDATLRWMGAIK
jgi:exosortase A-associated hydrolase 1